MPFNGVWFNVAWICHCSMNSFLPHAAALKSCQQKEQPCKRVLTSFGCICLSKGGSSWFRGWLLKVIAWYFFYAEDREIRKWVVQPGHLHHSFRLFETDKACVVPAMNHSIAICDLLSELKMLNVNSTFLLFLCENIQREQSQLHPKWQVGE